MILSILICALKERYHMLFNLRYALSKQCGRELPGMSSYEGTLELKTLEFENGVQIITAMDNGEITTGAKRNILLSESKGYYISFIDDDDEVSDYYVSEMLDASKSDADCFAINGIYTRDGCMETKWYLSKDNPNTTVLENGAQVFLRTTNHITAVKRELALQAGFPDISNGEDKEYMLRLKPLLKTEVIIEKPLYHYRYSSQNKKYK